MPITVVCPGCRSRFSVSEKFAGKEGPCPKCKQKIRIPKADEQVVIHAPEPAAGTKDKTGRPSLKPTLRQEARFNPLVAGLVAIVTVAAFGVAFTMKASAKANHGVPLWAAVTALAVLGPLLVVAGYSFLRDDELESYRGRELWIRAGLASLLYGLLWLAFTITFPILTGLNESPETPPEVYQWLYIAPIFLGIGTFIAWAALELEWGNAFLHYALYVFVMMLLRITMGLNGAWEFVPPVGA